MRGWASRGQPAYAVVAESLAEFVEQPRLSGPGFAHHADNLSSALAAQAPGVLKLLQLAHPADQRRLVAWRLPTGHVASPCPQHLVDSEGGRAFGLRRGPGNQLEQGASQPAHRLSGQDHAIAGPSGQPGGLVHGLAEQRRGALVAFAGRASPAGEKVAAAEPQGQAEGAAMGTPPLLAR